MLQPSTNFGAGGRSRGSPSFAPPSTQAVIVSISDCVKLGSFENCSTCGSACHGGISRLRIFWRMLRAHGRASLELMRCIGAASPVRGDSTQLLKRIGATSLLNVTADVDFGRPSALLDGATKKAEARVVSAVRAAKRVRFMVVTSFDSHCFSYGGCSR